jgi:hypothetical protein
MAGSVANTDQDRFVFTPGALKSLLSPRVPVNRIIGVLL